jgi:putative protease
MEVEVFCHGSLCYSYSGLCFFSGANDARSGNRGECAYTCRQPYKILSEGGEGFLFSMKDLDTSQHLDLLISSGVHALKIEGRKKDAQYVASVVKLYRSRLDQHFGFKTGRRPVEEIDEDLVRDDLSLSFQRQTTSLFLRNRYRENVIDLDSPTHLGVMCGKVAEAPANGSSRFAVTLACPLEVHDGVRVESVGDGERFHKLGRIYRNEDTQFGIKELWKKTAGGRMQRCFEAEAGESVEILLQPHAVLRPGDRIFKTRSADLKRRTEAIVSPRERLRAELRVDLELDVRRSENGGLNLTAHLLQHGEKLGSLMLDAGADALGQASWIEHFRLMGPTPDDTDQRVIMVDQLGVNDESLTIATTTLKYWKRQLRAFVLSAIKERRLARVAAVKIPRPGAQTRKATATASIAIKWDHPSMLDHLEAIGVDQLREFGVTELVFEAKRHLLAIAEQRDFLQRYLSLCDRFGLQARLALPLVTRGWDEAFLDQTIAAALDLGVRAFEVGNVYGFKLLSNLNLGPLDVSTDFSIYALNHQASTFIRDLGVSRWCLSIEDDLDNIEAHLKHQDASLVQAILYKDTPLFIAESCTLTALHKGCPTAKVCGYRTLHIENQKGERFYVGHESCKSVVYAEQAAGLTHLRDRYEALGVRSFRVDFLTRPYDCATVQSILHACARSRKIANTHTVNALGTLL